MTRQEIDVGAVVASMSEAEVRISLADMIRATGMLMDAVRNDAPLPREGRSAVDLTIETLALKNREAKALCAQVECLRALLRKVPIFRLDDDLLHYVCIGCGARSGMDRNGAEVDEDCKPDCWAHAIDATIGDQVST